MMALAEKPDPRKKLILAAGLDFIIIALGVALFLTSGSLLWILTAIFIGTGVSVPLFISAIRDMREQSNASG
jgi:integral membrane sensor domain MASE1